MPLKEKAMKTYKVNYSETTKNKVMDIVRNFSHDIIINKMEEDGVMITIELDDTEADDLYNRLVDAIGLKAHLYG